MVFRLVRSAAAAVLVSLPLAACVVQAEGVPDDVRAVLLPAFERVQKAESLQATVTQQGGIKLDGEMRQKMPEIQLTVTSAAPNRVVVRVAEPGKEAEAQTPMVSDGQSVFTLFDQRAYLKIPAAEDLATLIETSSLSFGPIDAVWFPMMLAGSDGTAKLYADIQEGSVVDRDAQEGRPAAHVQLRQKDAAWDVWVTTDAKPEILRLQADMSQRLRDANPRIPAGMKLEFVVAASFSGWDFGPKLSDDTFSFTPPEGAKGYDSLAALEKAMQPPPPMLGEDAPQIELPTLEGKPLNLASHKGKDVVVVDFWATWCGPCREGLPILDEVTKSLAADGVVAYAVNLQEDKETVAAFLKESPLSMRVALDLDTSAAQKFQVSGIPHTILIGKDGVIHAVHIGFSDADTYRAQLTEELKALIEGKSLLEEAAAEEPSEKGKE